MEGEGKSAGGERWVEGEQEMQRDGGSHKDAMKHTQGCRCGEASVPPCGFRWAIPGSLGS